VSNRNRLCLVCVIFTALTSGLAGDDRDQEKTTKLMRKKLEQAQKVLEGVAVKDFDLISRSAEELMLLSQQAQWHVLKTPRYEVSSNEFRRAVDDLIQKAKDKNLDGAALSYVEMTLACVKCHKYVREARMTRLDMPRGFHGDNSLLSWSAGQPSNDRGISPR
jgi:hypothetical protein